MSSIDKRVVEAEFDNRQFQQGVKSTLGSLDSLKKGLNLEGAAKGLDNVEASTSRVAHGFSLMRIAAYSAVATITRQAVYAAEHLVAAFTIDPIREGFQNYETQINAVQTILANTGLKGAKGLQQVNSVLAELNTYANKTVYNFSEMAKNIGTFTAAGVKLKPAAESIKGIANLAAASGSTSQQASTAMYQLSQAIAAGRVKLQDWNSVVNAGIGGKMFQEALFNTGQAMHTIKDAKLGETFTQWTNSGHTFRNELQKGWVTGKVLTQTLQNFTGDMTKAQLKSIGYNKEQIKTIQEQGKIAVEAATKIKTVSQLAQALKEEVGTAYAAVFKTVVGNINQAKSLLSPLHQTLENALTNPIYHFNNLLKGWSKLGGREALFQGLKKMFQDIGALLKPIKDAFHEIFPPATAQSLYHLTIGFKDLMSHLKIGADTAANLKRTFAGVFAVFDIGWQVLKQTVKFFADLLSTAGKGSGGILKATGSIGDFLVKLDQMIKKGDVIHKFFQAIMNLPFVTFLGTLVSHLFNVATTVGLIGPALNGALGWFQKIGKALKPIADGVKNFFANLFGHVDLANILQLFNLAFVGGIVLLVKKLVDKFKGGDSEGAGLLKKLTDSITEPFERLTTTLQQMQKTLQVAALLGIATAVGILATSALILSKIDPVALTKALTALGAMFGELLASVAVFNRIGGAKGLASTATGLVIFASAIRVLTSSVKALSQLNWDQLAKGLTGVAVLITGLVAASRGIDAESGGMVRAGAGLLVLSAGIKILAGAVGQLAGLSWGQMSKGLTGVATTLASLALFTKIADVDKMGVLKGAGLVLLATALRLMAGAISSFAKESWGQITKGIASVGAILAEFAIFSRAVGSPARMVASSAALIGISVAMNVLARALDKFSNLSWGQIAKGLVTMAGALAIIVVALDAIPPSSVLGAAAIVAVSIALVGIGYALSHMGGMSWGEIAKALVTLAGSLAIIAAAMIIMTEALPGAAALLVVSAALAMLVPELKILSTMSWGGIAKALVALAGAFVIIGAAGLVLTPVIPSLLGLGGAILLLGAGVAAIGGGVFLFATGLTALATSGAAAASALKLIFDTVIGFIPTLVKALGDVLVSLAKAIAVAAPELLKTAIVLIDSLIKAIAKEGPKIIDTFGNLILKFLDKLTEATPRVANDALKMMEAILTAIDNHTPQIVNKMSRLVVDMLNALSKHIGDMVDAGGNLIVHFLNGIANQEGKIIHAGANIVIKFVQGIASNSLRIINAAMDAILQFLNGIATAINVHAPEFRQAGLNIAEAIANGMTGGLASKVGSVAKSAENLAKSAYDSAKHFLHIGSPSKKFKELGGWSGEGFVQGLDQWTTASKKAGANIADAAFKGYTQQFRQTMHYLLNGFENQLVGGKSQVVQTIQNAQQALHGAVQQANQDLQQQKQNIVQLTQGREADDKAVRDATQSVTDARDRLNKLTTAHKQNTAEIQKAQVALQNAEQKLHDAVKAREEHEAALKKDTAALQINIEEHDKAKAALAAFNEEMDRHKQKLKDLGHEYDIYQQKIDNAKQALDNAKQTEQQYNDQINQQFSGLPDITNTTTVADYTQNLSDQVNNTQSFIDDINKLRDQFHISDDLYKELLSKGPAILPFVEELLSGGQAAVDQLNTLTTELDAEAKSMGDTASKSLYQAGVDSAQGLLDGLKAKQDDIKKQMEKIADIIAKAIRKALKVKSPSQVMHEIGEYVGMGLIEGMQAMEADIDKQGKALVDKMNSYIKQINDAFANQQNLSPTIKPVLDLSGVQQDASKLGGIFATKPISVDGVLSKATNVAIGYEANKAAAQTSSADTPVTQPSLTFVQNNTSPKALSAAEIYRQTNNQISQAKGALAKNAS